MGISTVPVTLRLREVRESKGWSQSELARRSGVGQPIISRLEGGGQASISFVQLDRLARALDTHPGLLFEYTLKPKRGRG